MSCSISMFCCCSVFTTGIIPSVVKRQTMSDLSLNFRSLQCASVLPSANVASMCLFHVLLWEPSSQSTLSAWKSRFILGVLSTNKTMSYFPFLLFIRNYRPSQGSSRAFKGSLKRSIQTNAELFSTVVPLEATRWATQ